MPDSSPDTATVAWLIGQALRPGDTLANGWVIQRVERLEDGSRFAVTTSPAAWRVVVELPRAGNRYHAETGRVAIWVDAADDSQTRPLREAVAQGIAERIRAVEQGGETLLPVAGPLRAHGMPTFYLTPGHLGDPDDLFSGVTRS